MYQEHNLGTIIDIKVVPKSSKTTLVGVQDGKLKIKVAAPPDKGKANKALTEYLAKKIGLPKAEVVLLSGQASRHKRVLIKGKSCKEVQKFLES
ncbi:MAG: DUF167 domain-containing protein [Chlamydiota bacterium]